MSQDDDLRLLKDCLDGKPGAWEAFVARFAPYLARVCARALAHCGRPARAQEVRDMLQEVFVSFLKHDLKVLRRYRSENGARVATYLAAVAVYRVLGDRSLSGPGLPLAGAVLQETAPGPRPLEALEIQETAAQLRDAMTQLNPQARLALAMQGNGASVREIGHALGLSEGAASQILHRARGQLRERLQP